MNNDCLDVSQIVDDWYGLANTSIFSTPEDILLNKEINKTKPPGGFSLAKLLNTFFVISKNKEITDLEKTTLYNVYNMGLYFIPLYFIIITFLFVSDYQPIWKIPSSPVINNIPRNFNLIYITMFTIVVILLGVNFYKKINCYSDLISYIKQTGFKNIYLITLYISIIMIILNIFILPSISSPIVSFFTKKEGLVKTLYKRFVILCVFGLFALILTIVGLVYYMKHRRIPSLINLDARYFSLFSQTSFFIYLIFSLLLITAIVTNIFRHIGQFAIKVILCGVFLFYGLIIYIFAYTVLQGGDYNKILLFTLLLIIFAILIGFYFLFQLLSTMEEVCRVAPDKEMGTAGVVINTVLPMILTVLFVYLFGKIYDKENFVGVNKKKFFLFYYIYLIIIIVSWFNSNLAVIGMFETLTLLYLTWLQWPWVKIIMGDTKVFIKGIINGIKKKLKKN